MNDLRPPRILAPVGAIQHRKDQTRRPLPAQSVIGRSRSCGVRVDDHFASGEHAKLMWTGSQWIIRDLGSRNGTFVDGKRLEPGKPAKLVNGTRIGFGEEDGPWVLVDDAAPGALATEVDSGDVRTAVGELLVLPDDDNPMVSVYPDPAGQGWVVESDDGATKRVDDQSILSVGAAAWRLELPVISEATPMVDVAMTLDTVDLRLAVTRDEERVEITVLLRGIETKLEPREHGYLILTLARAMREDADKSPEDRGWRSIPELSKMLRMEANAINVAIHRARQQLAAIGLEGAAGLVQVRRGQRRLGTPRFEIVTLEE